jgi:HNH endonuclease
MLTKLLHGVHYTVPEGPGCWEWAYSRNVLHGYGQITVNQQKYRAHRYAWLTLVGPIPDRMQVLHKCNNVGCVNPEHLYLGDHKTNGQQASRDGLLCSGEVKSDMIRRNWEAGVYDASVEINRRKALMRYREIYGRKP